MRKRTAVVCPVKPLVTGAIDENYPTSLNISQLLGSGNEQFVVPSYPKAVPRGARGRSMSFWMTYIYIEEAETHLLGSIVCLTTPHTAGVNKSDWLMVSNV